ncbi:DUF309 domain-containing protein [Paenibacillus athensensis]|uniref:DUF309 domain-containing protein n=1 Tax=Paenibacillus athensensis TaxID=1967502 RepID=A0A4Y8Q7Q9_9BACL|nr:DUF309 domain-containing protein [Paenibacillus athensensis]
MQYPQAYKDYLLFFQAERDYFECHEVMEEYWKAHPGDARSRTYVGLIQIAVALYHHRRDNKAGARKMLGSALVNLQPQHVEELGLDAPALRERLEAHLAALQEDSSEAAPFVDLDLPIRDAALLAECQALCAKRGLAWGCASALADEELVHKHTRRDRSGVIRERELQKQRRRDQGAAR